MRQYRIPDGMRNKGIHIVAGRGSGKSRLIGRYLAFSDFLRNIPTVLIDNGDSIDNLLDRVTRLPEDERRNAWSRIKYVNMAGMGGCVIPFPLYYRLDKESDFAVAERPLGVIRRIDPALQNAPIMGMNAVLDVGREVGRKIVSKGWQLTEAQSIFTDKEIAKRSDAFRIKVTPFLKEPTLRLITGAAKPGIDWQQVIDKKQIVLLDFRDVEQFGEDIARFLMRWVFEYLMEYIEHRGPVRNNPIAVYIDELSAMTACTSPAGEQLFSQDLNTLLHTTMRRHDMWLTLAHQAMHSQFPESIQRLLLSMELQIIGSLPDIDDAITIARQLNEIDPDRIKTSRYVTQKYKSEPDYINTYYTPQEQLYANAYPFRDLPPLTFQLVQVSGNTGYRVTIRNNEPGTYPDTELIASIRERLMQRDGRKKADIEKEIDSRVSAIAEKRETYTTEPQQRVSIRTKPPL